MFLSDWIRLIPAPLRHGGKRAIERLARG
jgi:hypothetical protein